MKQTLLAMTLFIMPLIALAHTRWFTEGELIPLQTTEPTALYLSILTTVGFLIIGIGIMLHQQNIFRLAFLQPKASHSYERAAATFTMVFGAFLLIAGTHEYLFSPNLTAEAGIPGALIFIQIAIGLAFMLGIGTRISAVILGTIWMSTFYYVGWVQAVENIWVLGTAVFIAVLGNDYFSLISFSFLRKIFLPYKCYALSILRISTGLTLVVLGFSEKILAPEFGVSFLQQYNWNFMQLLGFNFSDYLFTLSAGSVEILFGVIFILGVVTRLNALVVAIVFSTPLFILGPIELAGHLPHFVAVGLLLLFGNGGHFTLFNKYKDSSVCPHK